MGKSESVRYSDDGLALLSYPAESPARSFTVPARVKTIGKGAFADATNLWELAFEPGSALERIEEDAFRESGLERLELPAGVVEIGDRAFMDTEDWESFTFAPGSRLERIGNQAFEYAMLGEITLPAGLRIIGDGAFHEAYDTYISFEPGSRLEHIGREAFRGARMRRFDIPETLEKLGDHALYGLHLSGLHIPANLRELGAYSTPGYYLEEVTFAEGSCLEVIGPHAFSFGKFTRFHLPASVRRIGERAFADTDRLRSFHIPETGEPLTIGKEAFCATALDRITLPQRVAVVEPRAFRNTSMTIRVVHKERSESWAENWSANLTRAEWEAEGRQLEWRDAKEEQADRQVIWGWTGDKEKKSSGRGIRFSEDGSVLLQFPVKGSRREYTLPATVRKIAPGAFYGAAKLTRLEIPADSKLEVIGERAFAGSGLREITLPASLRRIERDAFWQPQDYDSASEREEERENFQQVELRRKPDLDTLAFVAGCDPEFIHPTAFAWFRIRTLRIPESMRLLEQCGDMLLLDGDTLVRFAQNPDRKTFLEPRTVTLPARVRRIGKDAFFLSDITELRVEPGSELEEIDDRAFASCSLTRALLPSSLGCIGHEAFANHCFDELLFAQGCGLETIATDAFKMSQLENVQIAQGNFPPSSGWYLADQVLYSIDQRVLLRYLPVREAGSFTVPPQVEQIAPGAFCGAEKLTELEFVPGSRLRVIGERAFVDSHIHTVTIPAGVERIEEEAFQADSFEPYGIRALYFELGSKLKFIGARAFQSCPIRNVIRIPDSVTFIQAQAFQARGQIMEYEVGDAKVTEELVPSNGKGAGQVVIGPGSKLEKVGESVFLGRRVIRGGIEVSFKKEEKNR